MLGLPYDTLVNIMNRCSCSDVVSVGSTCTQLRQATSQSLGHICSKETTDAQLRSMHKYLTRHGPHVCSLDVAGTTFGESASLRMLPPLHELRRISLSLLVVQLFSSVQLGVQRGMVQACPQLSSLQLRSCSILDTPNNMASALATLPRLRHLSIVHCTQRSNVEPPPPVVFPAAGVLGGMLQLTCLEVAGAYVQDPNPALMHLTHLTGLQHLRLQLASPWTLTEGMLQGLDVLTHLELFDDATVQAGVLAGKSKLAHLSLNHCMLHEGPQMLLSQLMQLTQLTHLCLCGSLHDASNGLAAAADYAALTASRSLQQLDLSECFVPAFLIRHVMPASRQLQSLQKLNLSGLIHQPGMQLPDMTRLANCCPQLQVLTTFGSLRADALPPLGNLGELRKLSIQIHDDALAAAPIVLCQLTKLRHLRVDGAGSAALMLDLRPLQHLTLLNLHGGYYEAVRFGSLCYARHTDCTCAMFICLCVVFRSSTG